MITCGQQSIYFKDTGWEGLDWIHLACGRYRWQAVVNTVMNIDFPYNVGNFLTSQEGLCSMQLR
jgi:hypothetical protein